MKMLVAGFALLVLAAPVAAAEASDARWDDWLGCWTLVTDEARSDGPVPAAAAIDRVLGFGPEADHAPSIGAPRVCVEPLDLRGVRLTTRHGNTVLHEQTIIADAQPHPVVGECGGTRRTEWSTGGIRLFSQAELHCADGTSRTGTSLSLITPGGAWVDIEAVISDGRESLQVRRYRRIDPAAGAGHAAAPFTFADIRETNGKVPPAVLEAALVETQASFSLRARDVVSLVDAGVPERVIDLMVALSYPERFVVERRVTPVSQPVSAFSGQNASMWGYYYTPFGYSSADYYHFHDRMFPRGGASWVPVVGGTLQVVESGGGGLSPPPSAPVAVGSPAVVNDLGYTRIRPRETEPPAGRSRPISPMTGNTGGSTTAISTGGGGGAASGGDGGGGGGSSVSPQGGYSSGGGGDTGRTAVPR